EYREAWHLVHHALLQLKVVLSFTRCDLLGTERHAEIAVEAAALRGDPIEIPTHPALELQNFLERCTRHRGKGNIARIEMGECAIKVIRDEGAAAATFLPAGPEHEVIHHQLASTLE